MYLDMNAYYKLNMHKNNIRMSKLPYFHLILYTEARIRKHASEVKLFCFGILSDTAPYELVSH